MSIATIHDKIEKLLNKQQKISTSDIQTINCQSWEEAKEKAKTVLVKPGWAVYFIRKDDFVDHIAIVPEQDEKMLNLYDAILLNSTPSPLGLGIGPLTNELSDKSGLRIISAYEYIELYERGYYQKILVNVALFFLIIFYQHSVHRLFFLQNHYDNVSYNLTYLV